MFTLVSFLQATVSPVETMDIAPSKGIIGLIFGTDLVMQTVVILLIILSVVSWAVIGSKHGQIKRAMKRTSAFLKNFRQADSIENIVKRGSFLKCPALNIFKSGIETIRQNTPTKSKEQLLQKEIMRTTETEIESLNSSMHLLATAASTAPFLGLFGTVWGVMNSFFEIGKTGATSLSVIGPHIAGALITTAIGLVVAVPAIIAYNTFANRIRMLSKNLEDFSEDLYERLDFEYMSGDKK